ncbi:hypothetical protein GSVR_26890 [Geobacter sp. SVR]|nr:hypothetical protein GSVR_26890 [Geobacter sp. SVR]
MCLPKESISCMYESFYPAGTYAINIGSMTAIWQPGISIPAIFGRSDRRRPGRGGTWAELR